MTNKVQSSITNYIAVEKSSDKLTGTNKKRKTISGELPDQKGPSPNMSSTSLNTQDPIIHPQPPISGKQHVLSETYDKDLSEEDKQFRRREQRLGLKMKELVKEGIKESMQEVMDNTLTAAMSKMTDAVNELIKTNRSVVTQQAPYMHWSMRIKP